MSTGDHIRGLHAKGRRILAVLWPDQEATSVTVGRGGCARMYPVAVSGPMGEATWIKAEFRDGTTVLYNVAHLESIQYGPTETKDEDGKGSQGGGTAGPSAGE